ncbi:MAG TPA: hypothetical protein VD883_02925 [Candidatus Omnitrophota bacterium]|nr:hypothetical protein [Candidatus Omnitrophota bacterium]
MKIVAMLLGVVFVTGAFMPEAGAYMSRNRRATGPILHTPGDNTDISGKKEVEFRWSPEGDRASFDYYDFRLYKGSQTYETGLILKRQVPEGETRTFVDAATFENGQTYAWSIRQVGGSKKGRTSYAVFKAIKST